MKNNKTNLNALDKRIYKYWQAWFLAFFSSRLYIDVGKRWRGWGLGYFFLLIAFVAIPISIKAIHMFNQYYKYEFLDPIEKIPSFEIRQERLVFPYFMPYLIKNKYNEVSIIIDENANLTEINYIYPRWMMVINRDHIYIRLPVLSFLASDRMAPKLANISTNNVDAQSFKNISYASFNGKYWVSESHLSKMRWYFLISMYPSLTMLLFGFFSVFLFFLAILGRAFSYTILKFKLDFKRTYRLMLVSAGTGVSVFILSLSYVKLPLLGFYLLLIITLYFFYAIMCLKRESKKMVLW